MEFKGRTHIYTLMTIIMISGSLICPSVCDTGAFLWKPKWMSNREDLLCYEDKCGQFQIESDGGYFDDTIDQCCPCHHAATWERDETLLTDLYVEFMNIFLDSIIIPLQPITNASLYQIIQTNSDMTRPPTNICDVPTMIKIDFSNNLIRSLQGFECVVSLDTLILHHNRITTVPNATFSSMYNLRNVDLSHNIIIEIAPFTLAHHGITLLNFNVSFNQLETLEVSNSLVLHPFCDIKFTHNSIQKFTNTDNFRVDFDHRYGPGNVLLGGNHFTEFPDLKDLLQLDSLQQLGKLLHIGFDMRGSSGITCDCTLVRTAQLTWDVIDSVFKDKEYMICGEPEHLKGTPVFDAPLENLTCKLEVDSGCPLGCHCVDQPFYDTVTVDCRNTGIDQLPTRVPDSAYSEKLKILASDNSIYEISGDVYYLDKVDVLDLSNNNLVEFPEDVAKKLINASSILLNNNLRLKYLPQSVQYRNPCAVRLDGLAVQCDCDSLWIYNWLDTRKCANYTPNFYCVVDGHGTIPATQFNPSMLDCVEYDTFIRNLGIGMSIFIIILIVGIVLLCVFRYEILIFCTIFVQENLKGTRLYENALKFDVFVSYDDRNDALNKWVYSIVKHFEKSGVRFYIPSRDMECGARLDETVKAIKESQTMFVILSDEYVENQKLTKLADNEEVDWTSNEWSYIWHNWIGPPYRKVVVVNYDHVVPQMVSDKKLKAYLRVGKVIEFTNDERNIKQRIRRELGILCTTSNPDINIDGNVNMAFRRRKVYPSTLTEYDL